MIFLRACCLMLVALLALPFSSAMATQARIKDLVEFEGVRGNDLVGYGLVVGLNGSGDGLRNSPYTEEALTTLLERLGVNVQGEQFRPKNVAAVLVTATLPAFARSGGRIDVTVSAIGDAKSLMGGVLIMTPLNAADGQIYAVAQGSVLAGGFAVEGDAAAVVQGVPTVGTIPGGARVERETGFNFSGMAQLRLALRDPDFTTASRIEDVVNRGLGGRVARMLDAGTVEVDLRGAPSPAHLVARIENLTLAPDQKARVVIDPRSGTIVLGSDVRLSAVAVAQGGLTVRVEEEPEAVQPSPFGAGQTVVVPRTNIGVDDARDQRMALVGETATLADLVDGLNALGVGPRGMIDILKAIKAAGALHADLITQ